MKQRCGLTAGQRRIAEAASGRRGASSCTHCHWMGNERAERRRSGGMECKSCSIAAAAFFDDNG